MKRIFISCIILICVALVLVQCKKESGTKEIHWTTYTTSDGLASNNINAIAIDKEGNKWFGTDAGISKFDGTTWTNYTTSDGLPGNRVRAIAIDKEGIKWFGTIGGISRFDGATWTNYLSDEEFSDGLIITAIGIDGQNNKWFGFSRDKPLSPRHGNGVLKFDKTNWINYTTSDGLCNNDVGVITIDIEGNKWFGIVPWSIYYQISGVSKFDDNTWTTYTTSDGLAGEYVFAIAIDKEDNKWFGTDAGVSKFDGTTWTNYTTSDGLVSNWVSAIAIDAKDNKWFGCSSTDWLMQDTMEGGVSKFDGTNWTNYTTADSLVSNNVKAIAIDKEGNIWFGTDQGISKLSYY